MRKKIPEIVKRVAREYAGEDAEEEIVLKGLVGYQLAQERCGDTGEDFETYTEYCICQEILKNLRLQQYARA